MLAAGTARYPSVLLRLHQQRRGAAPHRGAATARTNAGEAPSTWTLPVTSPGPVLSPEAVLLGHTPVDEKRVIGQVQLRLDTSGVRRAPEEPRRRLPRHRDPLLDRRLASVLPDPQAGHLLLQPADARHRGDRIGTTSRPRVDLDGDDELGRAANAINAMAASLELRELENISLQEELLKAMKLEVQEEKKRVMARLIQTNKMTSLGLLLSSMAHEINNPNASIRFSGHIIAKIWADVVPLLDGVWREEGEFYWVGCRFRRRGRRWRRTPAKIVENSERIARVVQGLRDYGVGDGAKLRPNLEMNEAVAAALSVLACQMKQDIRLKTVAWQRHPRRHREPAADRAGADQPDHERHAGASQRVRRGAAVAPVTTATRNEVVVEVQDTGAGIAAGDHGATFRAFLIPPSWTGAAAGWGFTSRSTSLPSMVGGCSSHLRGRGKGTLARIDTSGQSRRRFIG